MSQNPFEAFKFIVDQSFSPNGTPNRPFELETERKSTTFGNVCCEAHSMSPNLARKTHTKPSSKQ